MSDRAPLSPGVFVSTALWDEVGGNLQAASPGVQPVLFTPGDRLPDQDVARIEVACLSADMWPRWSGAYLRVCLDAPNLRWLHSFSAGIDNPVFRMFLDRGVRLTTSSGSSAVAIAHHVIMNLLVARRDLPAFLRAQAGHRWEPRDLDDVEGRTVGVVGMGPIGIEVARLCREFGMRPIGMRRSVRGDEPCETWPFERFHELLGVVDALVLAVPLTSNTAGLLGHDEFVLLRPGAHLVNVGRGGLIDEPALIDALRSGNVGWAALDVAMVEPLPFDSPLWDMANVVITPHSSAGTASTRRRAIELFNTNFERFVQGQPLHNEVI
jgi:phosphoglycerate dehydrogenase-like enzyme